MGSSWDSCSTIRSRSGNTCSKVAKDDVESPQATPTRGTSQRERRGPSVSVRIPPPVPVVSAVDRCQRPA